MNAEAASGQTRNVAWPHWMARFVAANDTSAFRDLLRSLESNPPLGGVSRKEADQVLALLQRFQSAGVVPDDAYQPLRGSTSGRRDAQLVIDAFRAHDRIAGSGEWKGKPSWSDDVATGLTVAEKLGDSG